LFLIPVCPCVCYCCCRCVLGVCVCVRLALLIALLGLLQRTASGGVWQLRVGGRHTVGRRRGLHRGALAGNSLHRNTPHQASQAETLVIPSFFARQRPPSTAALAPSLHSTMAVCTKTAWHWRGRLGRSLQRKGAHAQHRGHQHRASGEAV
jgi:hypothetical protein